MDAGKPGSSSIFAPSSRAKLGQCFLYSYLWAFLQGRKEFPLSSPHYDLTSSAVLSVMLRSVMSNLHCKRTTWQPHIKNRFSRNKGGSKEAVKVAFLGETCGFNEGVAEVGRVGFRIDFSIAVADELDLVSEKGSLDIFT